MVTLGFAVALFSAPPAINGRTSTSPFSRCVIHHAADDSASRAVSTLRKARGSDCFQRFSLSVLIFFAQAICFGDPFNSTSIYGLFYYGSVWHPKAGFPSPTRYSKTVPDSGAALYSYPLYVVTKLSDAIKSLSTTVSRHQHLTNPSRRQNCGKRRTDMVVRSSPHKSHIAGTSSR